MILYFNWQIFFSIKQEGQDGTIFTLLQLGADVNTKDVKGRTGLSFHTFFFTIQVLPENYTSDMYLLS